MAVSEQFKEQWLECQEFSAEECRLMTVFAEQIMTPNFIDSLNFLINSSNEKG